MARAWPVGAGVPFDGTRTLTVAVALPPSVSVTDVGWTVTVQPAGAPVAARVTGPAKWLEVTVTVKVRSVPSVVVSVAGLTASATPATGASIGTTTAASTSGTSSPPGFGPTVPTSQAARATRAKESASARGAMPASFANRVSLPTLRNHIRDCGSPGEASPRPRPGVPTWGVAKPLSRSHRQRNNDQPRLAHCPAFSHGLRCRIRSTFLPKYQRPAAQATLAR